MLKTLSSILLLGVLSMTTGLGATAYEALQVIRGSRGDSVLNQLIEVRGESGQPQPQSWTILMNDSTARGGIREFVVANGKIVSERTPVRGYAGHATLPSLNFSRLNLDSDGAFKIANEQSVKAKVGFDSVDYTLRTNDNTGAPLWVLRLFDYMGAPVGSIQVSAEDGKVLRAFQVDPDARVDSVAAASPRAASDSADDDDGVETHFGGVFGVIERTGKNIGNTVKRVTLRTAGTVQEVLTGERTVDDGLDEESGE